MNQDLDKGAAEGSFREMAPDRGGMVEPSFLEMRRHLDDVWHGIHEASDKYIFGRCKTSNTPNYFPSPEPDMRRW